MRSGVVCAIAVGSLSLVGGCSSAPAPNVIIVHDHSGSAGGSPSAGGSAPITFMPAGDAAPAPTTMTTMTEPTGSTSSGGSGSTGGASAATGIPCDVATYLSAKCLSCHGSPPLPSALASLVTYDDLQQTAKEDPTKNEATLSLARMKDTASPMPPGAPPSASDVAILQAWIDAGYPMGSCGGADGGAAPPPPPPPASVFDGAPAFTARTGSRAHNAGEDCMSCHQTGGGEAPRFSFGGTLYDGSGNPVAGAEVRLVDANGTATSVYTASNGTFYSRATAFGAPAHVGVRNATSSSDMLTALDATGGGCSSCHCTGSTCAVTPIHLP